MFRTWLRKRFAPRKRRRCAGAPERPAARWPHLWLERHKDRVVPAPLPTAILSAPTTALIGDTVPLSVSFSNTGNATGHGPFIDVELPTAGNVPSSGNGLSFV